MEFVRVVGTMAVALGLTYLIDRQLNKDMSFGFSIGMLWMTMVRLMAETFTQ